jgi:hypothetical protein
MPNQQVSPAYMPNQQVSPAYMPNQQVSPAYMPNQQVSPAYMPNQQVSPAYMPSQAISPYPGSYPGYYDGYENAPFINPAGYPGVSPYYDNAPIAPMYDNMYHPYPGVSPYSYGPNAPLYRDDTFQYTGYEDFSTNAQDTFINTSFESSTLNYPKFDGYTTTDYSHEQNPEGSNHPYFDPNTQLYTPTNEVSTRNEPGSYGVPYFEEDEQ